MKKEHTRIDDVVKIPLKNPSLTVNNHLQPTQIPQYHEEFRVIFAYALEGRWALLLSFLKSACLKRHFISKGKDLPWTLMRDILISGSATSPLFKETLLNLLTLPINEHIFY